MTQVEAIAVGESRKRRGKPGFVRYLGRNRQMLVGIGLLLALLVFSTVGALVYDVSRVNPLSVPVSQPPSAAYPLGTDSQGRDLMAAMILGTPLTVRIGVMAGLLGLLIGTLLAFVSAYYGGVVDAAISGIVDLGLTVPGLLVLIIVAVWSKGSLSIEQMALVIASLAWVHPTRVIRAQVLSLREKPYIQVARLSGMNGIVIIFKEMLPNLLPYLAAQLVSAVAAATLASIGLEALGLGSMQTPTLGITIYWAIFFSALLLGMWWWFIPPIVIIVMLILGLFNVSAGLDEVANPRLRKSA